MSNIYVKGPNNKVDNFDQKTKDLIYQYRIEQNLSYPEIAKKLKLAPVTVFKYVKKYLNPTFNSSLQTNQQKASTGNKWALKYTEDDIAVLLDDLYNFAVNSDNIMINRYIYRKYGKTPDWLPSLVVTYPFLREKLDEIKRLIADRIRDKSIQGKYNVSFAKDVIEEFDEDYLKLQQERANRSKKEESKESTLNINVIDWRKDKEKSSKKD